MIKTRIQRTRALSLARFGLARFPGSVPLPRAPIFSCCPVAFSALTFLYIYWRRFGLHLGTGLHWNMCDSVKRKWKQSSRFPQPWTLAPKIGAESILSSANTMSSPRSRSRTLSTNSTERASGRAVLCRDIP
jgi:hypothetical protein